MARRKTTVKRGEVGVVRKCRAGAGTRRYVRDRSEGVSAAGAKHTKQCQKCHHWYIAG